MVSTVGNLTSILHNIFTGKKFWMDVFCSTGCLEEYLLLVSLGMGSKDLKSFTPNKDSYCAAEETECMEVK